MGRVFAAKGFDRWSKIHDVDDAALTEAIDLADRGAVAAQLGGGLVKLRIARRGGGKSVGFRTIVALKVGERAIFLYGFAKSEVDNIDAEDLFRLKQFGKTLQRLDAEGINKALASGQIREINH